MNRFERWSVWSTTIAVAVTGIGFGWAKYLTTSSDPFSVVNHPLQPLFLKLHILVAPLFLLAIGSVAVRHIWKHFRSDTRWSRKSGIAAALSLAPMVASGYLIQVLTGQGWLVAMAAAHVAFGFLYLGGLGLHRWFLARPPPSRPEPGRRGSRGSSPRPRRPRPARPRAEAGHAARPTPAPTAGGDA